ncbi:MAG: M23 family metallopeptidase [Clostridia bacterium]|nr:M23 family metallopeptidase [Clostridia bacterium]
MKKTVIFVLAVLLVSIVCTCFAESEDTFKITTAYRWFVNSYRNVRSVKVSYYDNVYAYNHGEYALTPFSSAVPAEYFVKDSNGTLAVAPIVMDITDAMRIRLYGADFGETALLYGQYCERIKGKNGKSGFSGVHEGIDFVSYKGSKLHSILDGVVTRAGDKNGTIGIYNEEYDITLLYLHCQKINVKRGQEIKAGDIIGEEGGKAIYAGYENNVTYAKYGIRHVKTSHYTHVELRKGRHTSSSKYRDTKLSSDCPYEIMQQALGVTESGRAPVTEAAILEARRMREAAEAAARAEAEAKAAAEATPVPTPVPTPELKIVEEVPGTATEGYGFTQPEATPAPQTETEAPIIESTLPPTTI